MPSTRKFTTGFIEVYTIATFNEVKIMKLEVLYLLKDFYSIYSLKLTC